MLYSFQLELRLTRLRLEESNLFQVTGVSGNYDLMLKATAALEMSKVDAERQVLKPGDRPNRSGANL